MTTTPNQIEFYFPYKKDIYAGKNLLSATAYYPKIKKNLINHNNQKCDGFYELQNELAEKIKNKRNDFKVFHLFYEFGSNHYKSSNDLIGIVLNFKSIEKIKLKARKKTHYRFRELVSYNEYKKLFLRGEKSLRRGDCYQYNLTIPFEFKLKKMITFSQLMGNLWEKEESRGAYAHGTYLPSLGISILSNSPECLFQIYRQGDESIIETMPIKGTLKSTNKDFSKQWEKLKSSYKDQCELYMITDLLKNDLAKIDARNVIVEKLKAPLIVPGILHQYSKISTKTKRDLALGEIVQSLFPGGSITGAPKKKVMEIIDQLENRNRGIYCGSTIISFGKLRAASINIRTALYDHHDNCLHYQAGGGITLQSDAQDEWEEIQNKVESFSSLL